MSQIGDRIGALLSATRDEVQLLGYGVYAGEAIPDAAAGGMAELVRSAGMTNPKLVLDNGQVVWGCECWWGPEAEVRQRVAQYPRVSQADIEAVRRPDGKKPGGAA